MNQIANNAAGQQDGATLSNNGQHPEADLPRPPKRARIIRAGTSSSSECWIQTYCLNAPKSLVLRVSNRCRIHIVPLAREDEENGAADIQVDFD